MVRLEADKEVSSQKPIVRGWFEANNSIQPVNRETLISGTSSKCTDLFGTKSDRQLD